LTLATTSILLFSEIVQSALLTRSMLNFTSSAVKSAPPANFTSGCSWKV
jgi:hypothetical protein